MSTGFPGLTDNPHSLDEEEKKDFSLYCGIQQILIQQGTAVLCLYIYTYVYIYTALSCFLWHSWGRAIYINMYMKNRHWGGKDHSCGQKKGFRKQRSVQGCRRHRNWPTFPSLLWEASGWHAAFSHKCCFALTITFPQVCLNKASTGLFMDHP